jgi:hypothetical protein
MPSCFPLFLATLVILAVRLDVFAQDSSDNDDTQSWNDLQISIPVSSKVDIQLLSTVRFGKNITRFEHGRIGAGVAVEIGKGFSTGANYQFIESRGTSGRFSAEHRYTIRGTYKFPVKSFGLSHRSTYEYRVRGSGNLWRYRAAITLEKKLPSKWIRDSKAFVTEEIFYVSTAGRFSRNRISAGISKKLNDRLTLDVYYLRQNDGTSRPGNLHVLGTAWKIKL